MTKQGTHNIVLACTGASGMIYTKVLLNKLQQSPEVEEIGLIFSENAKQIWKSEIGNQLPSTQGKVTLYGDTDFYAPFASGSSQYTSMVICPSSMGILGRIAHGISDCLITRAADVMMKERRKLILVPRETPYNLVHIKNMELITISGGIICPATPSFYNSPTTIEQIALTVIDRVIDLMDIPNETFRWGAS